MDVSGWSLREELSELIERWYLAVLVFLIGGVMGWGAAHIFPADYEVRAPLFVAFNSDALFTSPDDYKNAQFEEVTDLILSDALLDEVLAELEEDWNRADLRNRFSVQWRNAGRWELVVRDRDPDRAARVAAVWRDCAFGLMTGAISHAQTFYQLDLELQAITRAQGETYREQARLQAVEMALRAWLAQPDEPVSAQERAELFALARAVSIPDGFPDDGAGRPAYVDWAEGLLAVVEAEHALLEAQDQILREQLVSLRIDWLEEKTDSRGLSAFLVVEMALSTTGGEVEGEEVREPGVLALVGGVVGVLGWVGFRLVNVARQGAARKGEEGDGENN